MGQQVFWETTEHTKHTLCVEVPLHVMLNWTKQKRDKFGFMVDTFCLFIPTATVISVHPDTCPRYSNQRGHSRHTKCPFWFGSLRLFFCFEEPQQSMPGCGTNRHPPPPPTHTHKATPAPAVITMNHRHSNIVKEASHNWGHQPLSRWLASTSVYTCTVCTDVQYVHMHASTLTNALAWTSVYTCTVCTHALYVHMHAYTLANACTYTHMQIHSVPNINGDLP